MTKAKLGDKVIRDTTTQNQGKVRLGEAAPMFRPVRTGDKVVRDAATKKGQGEARRHRPGVPAHSLRRQGRARTAASEDQGKVCLGEAPRFSGPFAQATKSCGMRQVKIRARPGWEKPPLYSTGNVSDGCLPAGRKALPRTN